MECRILCHSHFLCIIFKYHRSVRFVQKSLLFITLLLRFILLLWCYGDIMILWYYGGAHLLCMAFWLMHLSNSFIAVTALLCQLLHSPYVFHVLSWMQVLRSSHYTPFWLQVGLMIGFMVIKFSWIQSFKILLSPSKVGMCSRLFRFGPDSLSRAVLFMLFFVKKTWNQTVQNLLSCSPCLNQIFGVLDI